MNLDAIAKAVGDRMMLGILGCGLRKVFSSIGFGPLMTEVDLTGEEYRAYFPKLGGLRESVARAVIREPGMRILDLATGYGFFAIELLKAEATLDIVGIDLSQTDIIEAENNVRDKGVANNIRIMKMDATRMDIGDESFDMVVNFLGLEDIHMTRGLDGVKATFSEAHRVLKPDGRFCFVALPPDRMETRAQKTDVALFSEICGATWLESQEYESILRSAGFELVRKEEFRTGKKLTPDQAREEIAFACENVPIIYGIPTPTFDEVWHKYGKDIEEHGLGHYSKVVLFEAGRVEYLSLTDASEDKCLGCGDPSSNGEGHQGRAPNYTR